MAADDISGVAEAIDYRVAVSSVETPDGAPEFRRKLRAGWKRYAFASAGIAIVVVTFALVLPKIADYRDVWDVVTTLTWEWIVVLAAATVLNLATFAPPWVVTLPGLGFLRALSRPRCSALQPSSASLCSGSLLHCSLWCCTPRTWRRR